MTTPSQAGIKRQWQAPTGMAAFGRPVPTERQVAALDCAVEAMGCDPLLADPIITEAAKRLERDEIHEAFIVLRNLVDLTGAYRLVAVMCTDNPGKQEGES